ncbi:MAG TPA: hypothetical protein VFP84_27885 [Kofleriaceae bacterium]|nr:hypothetical protein [Kofleriaceae bacterium]
MNSLINPRVNSLINPRVNSLINPRVNSLINPRVNSLINPRVNSLINYRVNSLLNPVSNPGVNPAMNNFVNPHMNANIAGYYVLDLDYNIVGYTVVANASVSLLFDVNSAHIGILVRHGQGGYCVFDLLNDWTIHLVERDHGFNSHTQDNEWIGVLV